MPTATIDFADAAAYERFMGRWSRAVAPTFLDWLAPPRHARWLDVGCGTGILSEAIADLCDPSSVVGIDSSAAQISAMSQGRHGTRASFREGDAMALPFGGDSFDVVASALVINFVPDPMLALREMQRVAARPGLIAGYVWDFGNELSPSGPFRRGMRASGLEVPAIPGTDICSTDALSSLFRDAGCDDVETRTIDVVLAYADFDDFWSAQTPSYGPTTRIVRSLPDAALRRLMRTMRESLPSGRGGRIEYAARACAIKATAGGCSR